MHFYADSEACTVQTVVWMADSMKVLGVPLSNRPSCFVHNPVPMHRDIVLDLRNCMERKYSKRWIDVFMENHLTEYTTYGVFARDVNALSKLHMTIPPHTLNFWVAETMKSFETELIEKVSTLDVRFVCIQSNIGRSVSEYRTVVEQVWKSVGM